MERQKFEESWQEAFDNAEVKPSENVWKNLELDLEKAKGAQLKRRLVFFQLLAAASLVFAIGVGIGVYFLNRGAVKPTNALVFHPRVQQKTTTDQKESIQERTKTETAAPDQLKSEETHETITSEAGNAAKNLQQSVLKKAGKKSQVPNTDKSSSDIIDSNSISIAVADSKLPSEEKLFSTINRQHVLPRFVENKKIEFIPLEAAPETDPVATMLARLDQREAELRDSNSAKKDKKEKKGRRSETLWTSIGVAAGTFNTFNSGAEATAANMDFLSAQSTYGDDATKASIASRQVSAPGMAYSMGVSVGTKVANRWVLQGGVNYLTQLSEYEAQNAVTIVRSDMSTSFRPASLNELGGQAQGAATEKTIVTTAPYNINNDIRYLSVPLQAGYLLINKDVGLQVNAGVATDLFLRNTIAADGENMDRSKLDSEDNSLYRAVNFNGIIGTEVSYRFAEHYRVSLNPGVRYPLNTIYKSEVGVNANPLTFDVGLRFRYIFN